MPCNPYEKVEKLVMQILGIQKETLNKVYKIVPEFLKGQIKWSMEMFPKFPTGKLKDYPE